MMGRFYQRCRLWLIQVTAAPEVRPRKATVNSGHTQNFNVTSGDSFLWIHVQVVCKTKKNKHDLIKLMNNSLFKAAGLTENIYIFSNGVVCFYIVAGSQWGWVYMYKINIKQSNTHHQYSERVWLWILYKVTNPSTRNLKTAIHSENNASNVFPSTLRRWN